MSVKAFEFDQRDGGSVFCIVLPLWLSFDLPLDVLLLPGLVVLELLLLPTCLSQRRGVDVSPSRLNTISIGLLTSFIS